MRPRHVAVYVFRETRGPDVGKHLQFLQLLRCDPRDVYPGTWQTVYGGIREGETAIDAAFRELHEETGFRPQALFQLEYVETFYSRHSDEVVMMPTFGAQVDANADPVLNDEHDDFRWVDAAQVDQLFMWRSQREAVRVLLDCLARGGEGHRLLHIPLPAAEPEA